MFANGVPVRIATSFLRTNIFADTRMAEPDFVRPSLQSAIEDLGDAFGRAEEASYPADPRCSSAKPSTSNPTYGSSKSCARATAPKAPRSTPSKPSVLPPGTSFRSARSPASTSSDVPNPALIDQARGRSWSLAEARQRAKRRPVQLTQQEPEMTLPLGDASVVHRFGCEELRTDVETKES
jgi:hypothetical protein